jgi:hypothetical protein
MASNEWGLPTVPALLLSEGFLHLAEFPLNLPNRFFDFAPRLQAAIVRQLSCLLFDPALEFVKLAFGLVSGASLHHGCSLAWDSGSRPRFSALSFKCVYAYADRYLRQREYPQRPPPNKSSSRTTIKRSSMSHLTH